MLVVDIYDTKPYDRQYLQKAFESANITPRFFDFRLNVESAVTAKGANAICMFVNDVADRACLEVLAQSGVKMIALRCAGFNNIDIDAAKELNLAVTRVPAYSPHAVAEHTIGLLLSLNRKIHRAYNRVRDLNFSLNGLIGYDITGKTAGIIGTGKIGKIVAQILRGFDAKVIAFDPVHDLEWARKHEIDYVDLPTLLKKSDIISLHVPLAPETFHMIDERAFELMKPDVFLLNTSRGKVIKTSALIKALKSGHVRGVALDTYEEEEGVFFEDLSGKILQDDELSHLLTFPNVLITAHQGFFTDEALKEIAKITATNVKAFADGTPFLPGTVLT
jgi:D-lactate dehydrogenase